MNLSVYSCHQVCTAIDWYLKRHWKDCGTNWMTLHARSRHHEARYLLRYDYIDRSTYALAALVVGRSGR